jgi:hypothetical protein
MTALEVLGRAGPGLRCSRAGRYGARGGGHRGAVPLRLPGRVNVRLAPGGRPSEDELAPRAGEAVCLSRVDPGGWASASPLPLRTRLELMGFPTASEGADDRCTRLARAQHSRRLPVGQTGDSAEY